MVLRRDSPGVVADREADPTAAAGSTNLWSKTAMPDALVAAARISDQYQKRPAKERRGIANHDAALFLRDTVGPRAATLPTDVEEEESQRLDAVACCWEAKKNVCRRVLGAGAAARVDKLCGLFSRFADDLGDGPPCSGLLQLRGLGEGTLGREATPLDVVVLLILPRKQPKVQIFARCRWEGAAAVCPPGPLSFVVRLEAASPFCDGIPSVAVCTSDELASELVSLRAVWSVVPLVWIEPPSQPPSLISFLVIGRSPAVEERRGGRRGPSRPSRTAAGIVHLLTSLEWEEDPAAAAASQRHLLELEAAEDFLLGIPVDFVEDAAAELSVMIGASAEVDGLDAVAAEEADEEADGASDVSSNPDKEVAVVEAEVAGAAAAGPEMDGPLDLVALMAFADAAVVDADGWVTCPLPPWNDLPSVGRLTSWRKEWPVEKRSFSCKCSYHVHCTSPARKFRHVPPKWHLMWLFAGALEPYCPLGRSEELATLHTKLFAEVVDQTAGSVKAAAASSSAAAASASSSGL